MVEGGSWRELLDDGTRNPLTDKEEEAAERESYADSLLGMVDEFIWVSDWREGGKVEGGGISPASRFTALLLYDLDTEGSERCILFRLGNAGGVSSLSSSSVLVTDKVTVPAAIVDEARVVVELSVVVSFVDP